MHPMSESDEPTVFDVLEGKGIIQIILEIGVGSAKFDDIEENVVVSSSTVSKRLKEGTQAHIFDIKYRTTDYGTQKRYVLTGFGKQIHEIIQETDINTMVREYQRAKQKYELASELLLNNVEHHDSLVYLNEFQQKSNSELDKFDIPEFGLPEEIEGYLAKQGDLDNEKRDGWIEGLEELEIESSDDASELKDALQTIMEAQSEETTTDNEEANSEK